VSREELREALARSQHARKAARARWHDGAQQRKLAAALGIHRTTLHRYELPESDPRHRRMPDDVRKKYERLVKR
jgi:DNA-binding XRE family transcriptional regulator